jgi:hypothetical protein
MSCQWDPLIPLLDAGAPAESGASSREDRSIYNRSPARVRGDFSRSLRAPRGAGIE